MAIRCIFATGVACWANYLFMILKFFEFFDFWDIQSSKEHELFGDGVLSKDHS